jgi:hypothetical protein
MRATIHFRLAMRCDEGLPGHHRSLVYYRGPRAIRGQIFILDKGRPICSCFVLVEVKSGAENEYGGS